MKNIKEKIAYLQGLAKGMDIESSSKEGQVLTGIIDVLDEMADQLEDIEVAQVDLEDYVESIDEDLYDLEDNVFGDDDMDIDMEEMVEVECPKCHETVCFEASIVADDDLIEVTCPNCDEVVFVNDDEFVADVDDDSMITSSRDEDL